MTGKKVDLSHLKVFGCHAFAHIPDIKRRKLDEKSKKYIFVGYSETSLGYRLLDPEKHTIKIARDVVFLENSFIDSNIENAPVLPRDPAVTFLRPEDHQNIDHQPPDAPEQPPESHDSE